MAKDSKQSKLWFKRIALGLGATILVLIVLVIGWLWIGGYDIEPPDTSDLAYDEVAIPDQVNGYNFFEQACEALDDSAYNPEMRDWIDDESYEPSDAARELVAANSKPYKLLVKAAACERFLAPRPQSMGDPVPHMRERQVLWTMLSIKCRIEQKDGDFEQAVSTCGVLIKLSRLMLQEPQCLLDAVIGMGAQQVAFPLIEQLATNEEVPASSLKHLQEHMNVGVPVGESMARGFLGDYHLMSKTLDEMSRPYADHARGLQIPGLGRWPVISKSTLLARYTNHPNRTQLQLAEFTRNMVAKARHPHKHADLATEAEYMSDDVGMLDYLAKPNAVGMLLMSACEFANRGMVDASMPAATRFEMSKLLLAMHRHRRDHGAFPESLDGLKGSYVDEIPLDPYDGNPLHYSHEEQIIYSAGRDGVRTSEMHDDIVMHLFDGLQ